MANYNKKISDTTVRLGEGRFSFVHVFAPRQGDDGKPGKYGVAFTWDKTDDNTTNMVKGAINAARELAKTKGIKLPTNCKVPLRDGDIDREDDENFAGKYFFNANCGQKPGVRVLDNGQVIEAIDEEDFYSGCYGAITVNFFPYDSNGNKGIGAGLNNVIKTKDGPKLSGGTNADADFADMGGSVLD